MYATKQGTCLMFVSHLYLYLFDMKLRKQQMNVQRPRLCIFTLLLQCVPEKGPRQNQYWESLYEFRRNTERLHCSLLSLLMSNALSIICSTKTFFVDDFSSSRDGGGRRGGGWLRQQWQVFCARHNFITTSWAMKNMTSSGFDVTAVEGESEVWKAALQIDSSFYTPHKVIYLTVVHMYSGILL